MAISGFALEIRELGVGSIGGPHVHLLDAGAAGLSRDELRARARSFEPARGAPHVSRSYRHPYALIAWHTTAVGVDIERIESCDAAFARSICTPSETVAFRDLPDHDACLTSLWSGKEALAKALGDPLAYDPRRLEGPMLWPGHRAGPWRAAQLPVPPGYVAWVCWRQGLQAAGLAPS